MRRLFVLAGVVGLLASPARGADPVCALLDPDRAPVAALLEAKQLAEPGAT